MDQQDQVIEMISQQGMLPLFYDDDAETCLKITRALYSAGIRIIEFTNRGRNAWKNFKSIRSERDSSMKDLLLAVGTIRSADQASRFVDDGADFLVSPVFDAAVCDVAYLNKLLWIPGCMTPTEIHVAEQAGCKLIKIFPGNVLGPQFINSVREIFPGLSFIPTGGVELKEDNISAWLNAGACAVGIGSSLIGKSVTEGKEMEQLINETKNLLGIIAAIRSADKK